ncbi:MAG: hypothetical protein ACK56I_22570, partial [bacterium]
LQYVAVVGLQPPQQAAQLHRGIQHAVEAGPFGGIGRFVDCLGGVEVLLAQPWVPNPPRLVALRKSFAGQGEERLQLFVGRVLPQAAVFDQAAAVIESLHNSRP